MSDAQKQFDGVQHIRFGPIFFLGTLQLGWVRFRIDHQFVFYEGVPEFVSVGCKRNGLGFACVFQENFETRTEFFVIFRHPQRERGTGLFERRC